MSHLQKIKMTYLEHMLGAFGYAAKSLIASAIFVFHGIFPDYCVYTGSDMIRNLHNKLVKTRYEEENRKECEEETNNVEKMI